MTDIAELFLIDPSTVILQTATLQKTWTYKADEGYPDLETDITHAFIPEEKTECFDRTAIQRDKLLVADLLFLVKHNERMQLCEPVDLHRGPKLCGGIGGSYRMADFFNELALEKKRRDKLLTQYPSLIEGYEQLKNEGILITWQTGSFGSYKLRRNHPKHHIMLNTKLQKFPASLELTFLHELAHAHLERCGFNHSPKKYLLGTTHDGEKMDGSIFHNFIEYAVETLAARAYVAKRASIITLPLTGYHKRSKIVVN